MKRVEAFFVHDYFTGKIVPLPSTDYRGVKAISQAIMSVLSHSYRRTSRKHHIPVCAVLSALVLSYYTGMRFEEKTGEICTPSSRAKYHFSIRKMLILGGIYGNGFATNKGAPLSTNTLYKTFQHLFHACSTFAGHLMALAMRRTHTYSLDGLSLTRVLREGNSAR